MVEQSFWEMLRTKRDSLTKSGTIVADYLVQHAEDAQYLSISSLAKACGVAEATIFRFCRSLGFDGYNEMKIALAKANAMTVPVALKLEPGVDTQILCTHAYNTAEIKADEQINVRGSPRPWRFPSVRVLESHLPGHHAGCCFRLSALLYHVPR